MKITIFNPNGSVKEVLEYHFQVPVFITTFQNNHSFLNISEEDVALTSFRGKNVDKDFLIKQYRFLIKCDFDNYVQSIISSEDKPDQTSDANKLDYYNHVLSILLRSYGPTYYEFKSGLTEEERQLFNTNLWLETLLFHAKNANNRVHRKFGQYESCEFNNLLSIIHRLYYALKKANKLGHLNEKEQCVMHALYPFANMQSSKAANTCILDNDNVLVKLIKSLYQTKEECRDIMYALTYYAQLLSFGKHPNAHKASFGYVAMIQRNSGVKGETITIKANPSNSIELSQIEFLKEEIVCLRCPNVKINKDLIKKTGDVLKEEYDSFYKLNSDDVKKSVENKVLRQYKFKRPDILTPKHWKEFYYMSLAELENEYKIQYERVKGLEVPYYYYYLLVDKCYSCQRYAFNDYLLESLIYMASQNKLSERSSLYDQMLRLNYMEEEAGLINKEDSSNGDPQKIKMDNLRNDLLNSEDADIVERIFDGHNESLRSDDKLLVKSILIFLSPLFNEEYILGMKVAYFRGLLKSIFENEIILGSLKQKKFNQFFNIILVFNIIGYLSPENKKYLAVVKPPLNEHLAGKLCQDLDSLWKLSLSVNVRKCITQWAYILEKEKYKTYTNFTAAIKNAVDDEWKNYKIKMTKADLLSC